MAQNTLAGENVELDRVDGVEPGDMPRLIVFSEEEGAGVSSAGGPPAFDMTLTLVVQALVERAARDDVVRDLDTLILQTQLALLEDPVWNRLAGEVATMRVSRTFRGDADMIVGDGRIEFTLTWRENYETRLGPMLTGVNLKSTPDAQPIQTAITRTPNSPPHRRRASMARTAELKSPRRSTCPSDRFLRRAVRRCFPMMETCACPDRSAFNTSRRTCASRCSSVEIDNSQAGVNQDTQRALLIGSTINALPVAPIYVATVAQAIAPVRCKLHAGAHDGEVP